MPVYSCKCIRGSVFMQVYLCKRTRASVFVQVYSNKCIRALGFRALGFRALGFRVYGLGFRAPKRGATCIQNEVNKGAPLPGPHCRSSFYLKFVLNRSLSCPRTMSFLFLLEICIKSLRIGFSILTWFLYVDCCKNLWGWVFEVGQSNGAISIYAPISYPHYTIAKLRYKKICSGDHESWWGWVFDNGESNGAIRFYVQLLALTILYITQGKTKTAVVTVKVGGGWFSITANRMVLSAFMYNHLPLLYYTQHKAKRNLQLWPWKLVGVGFR